MLKPIKNSELRIKNAKFDFVIHKERRSNMVKRITEKYTEVQMKGLEEELRRGTQMAGGEERVAFLYATEKDAKERTNFIRDEYGTGGRSGRDGSPVLGSSFDAKGFHLRFEDNEDVVFPWNIVEKELGRIMQDKENPYLKSLYQQEKGIIIMPVENQPFKMKNGANPTFDKITTLYPKVREVLMNNCSNYAPEVLDGKIQRIGLTDKLTLGLVYCRHGKTERDGDGDKFAEGVAKFLKKYPDEKVKVFGDFGLTYGMDSLRGYVNLPLKDADKVTEKLYDLKAGNLEIRDVFTGYRMEEKVFEAFIKKEELKKDGWESIPEGLQAELDEMFEAHDEDEQEEER